MTILFSALALLIFIAISFIRNGDETADEERRYGIEAGIYGVFLGFLFFVYYIITQWNIL